MHHNSGVSAVCANYDAFLWVFPRKVVRIRMNFRNSLYNAPAKKVTIFNADHDTASSGKDLLG